jgi:hypothetical protein
VYQTSTRRFIGNATTQQENEYIGVSIFPLQEKERAGNKKLMIGIEKNH